MKRWNIVYSGTVQGVGFRFTVKHIARGLDISGWVMNLENGDVEVEIEGDHKDLEEFDKRIRDQLSGYIRNVKLNEMPYNGDYHSFEIKYY